MSAIYISAAHKSSGKTVLSIGLCAALRASGRSVQSFKKGPDYIDPIWLSRASGADCQNLDFHTMTSQEIVSDFAAFGYGADVTLIEGNKGLHDSVDLEGRHSNAALAKLLGTPVVLVVDTRGMTRGVAAIVHGMASFDARVQIAGVIFNQVRGSRHEHKLRRAVEAYTDIPVLGAVASNPDLSIDETHLGLVPATESEAAEGQIAVIGRTVASQVDIDALLRLDKNSSGRTHAFTPRAAPVCNADLKLAVARDKAFGFYYPGDLASLRAGGADLVPIDTLTDRALPAVDGIFLGGGFPERHMDALSENSSLRKEMADAIHRGMPVYAECGGLMYLSRQIVWGEKRRSMVGALDVESVMSDRPQGRGYVRLRETEHAPWPRVSNHDGGDLLAAHEFHYSSVRDVGADVRFAYDVLRGHGIDGNRDGIVFNNVLASYSHLRDTVGNRWTQRFLSFIRACKSANPTLNLSSNHL